MSNDLASGSKVSDSAPYSIVNRLSEGGMARTYVAQYQDPAAGTWGYILLKITQTVPEPGIQKLYEDCLSNEVETLKRLCHPGVVKILPMPWDTSRDAYIARATALPGQPWFFAMEYLEGGSLEERLQKYKQFFVEEAVEIACQVAEALKYIHAHGIAHLDVKPENILFRRQISRYAKPEAVLIDFGVARRNQQRRLDVGTMSYVSPERIRMVKGEIPPEDVGHQYLADVYSLGIILYRMLTGHLPFKIKGNSASTTDILGKKLIPPTRYNRDIPAPLEELVLEMMNEAPGRRPSLDVVISRFNQIAPPPRFFLEQRPAVETGNGATKAVGVLLRVIMAAIISLAVTGAVGLLAIAWGNGMFPFARLSTTETPTTAPGLPVGTAVGSLRPSATPDAGIPGTRAMPGPPGTPSPTAPMAKDDLQIVSVYPPEGTVLRGGEPIISGSMTISYTLASSPEGVIKLVGESKLGLLPVSLVLTSVPVKQGQRIVVLGPVENLVLPPQITEFTVSVVLYGDQAGTQALGSRHVSYSVR